MDGSLRWLPGIFRNSSRRSPKPRVRRQRPFPIEPLEERLLLSATGAPAPSTAAQNALGQLADPSIRQLAQADYAAHQSITRNDLLSIFTEVEQDHVVSAAEFSSLGALVSNAATIGMPASVANLANKVVNGNPANVFLKSAASPNGDLFAGCAVSQLKSLVANWFEGMGPIAMTSSTAKLTWVNGVLFAKGGPQYTDVDQGVIGDCTLLAGLAEVALRQPATIQNMFTDNGDGTFTVRLYHNGTADYVTVDTQLPNAGQLYDRVTNGVLWAALAEKAIVEENESGWLATGEPGSDSYAALNGGDQGTAVAYLSAITGLPSSAYGVNPSNIVADWQANKLVLLSTGSVPAGSNLVADHCYAMVGYNAASGTPITLYNPWGAAYGQPSIATSALTASFQFEAAVASALEPNAQVPSIPTPAAIAARDAAASATPSVPLQSGSIANTKAASVERDSQPQSTRALDEFFASWIAPTGAGFAA
jgi:hypothetical protein